MNKIKYFLIMLYSLFIPIIGWVVVTTYLSKSDQKIIGYILLSLYLISLIFLFIFGILNIRNSIKLQKENDLNELKKSTKLIKIGAIPFFVLNFLVSVFFIAISHGMGLLIAPLLVFLTYLILLVTSSYSICLINLIMKKELKSNKWMLIQILLQLCFVFDILGLFFILNKKYYMEN
ncbi:MAG: hypothetical protein GY760_21640 [Deltaproteobacteria bacterium]|nr:hypothetical protein [Deltaproteobacteria bacterium]